MAPEQQGRHDLVEFLIQENVRLEVYWRDDQAGYGPAVSIYAYDQEVLRLDCFGEENDKKGRGHCHVNLRQTRARQWNYLPGTVKDHIGQAMHDMRENLNYCLQTNVDERIQNTTVDSSTLEPIARQVEAKMLRFMNQLGLE